ncbi:RidA family protein [Coralliovum pocilloporae]|uniref:RidA family protein n=1 Tax=Coralliovum pocilloporae TaxID=3066369 RepID=UPI0033072EB1
MRREILQGSVFEEQIGYARAVVHGNMVFVSGTTGYDYAAQTISDDVVEQTKQCLKNIEWALNEADAAMHQVVRVHYILPDADDFPKCHSTLRDAFGGSKPAATMFSAGLADPKMKIEIEVTAIKD